jgi:hypothetical protein
MRITDIATLLIERLRALSPESQVWIKTVPWKKNELDGAIVNSAGQDIPALGALADGLAPKS